MNNASLEIVRDRAIYAYKLAGKAALPQLKDLLYFAGAISEKKRAVSTMANMVKTKEALQVLQEYQRDYAKDSNADESLLAGLDYNIKKMRGELK